MWRVDGGWPILAEGVGLHTLAAETCLRHGRGLQVMCHVSVQSSAEISMMQKTEQAMLQLQVLQ